MRPQNSQTQFSDRAVDYKARVEQVMVDFVGAKRLQGRLGEAVNYAIATDGKRIRPLIVYATAELLGVPLTIADYPAAAIELVHIYSLVHDDLPAMDDDDLRRGEPTVHKQFDEATGILVGDALLTFAFELLAESSVEPSLIVEWVRLLSKAAGANGMIAGQSTDIEGETCVLALDELEQMHRQKSGALIETGLSMVCNEVLTATLGGGANDASQLQGFGHHIGLAFQIRDDLLDVEGATEQIGKPQGSDAASNKSTFTSLLGVETARNRMHQELAAAQQQLSCFEERAEGLNWIAEYIVSRSK
jgi:geranylgeranyl pyrophosphate synthase